MTYIINKLDLGLKKIENFVVISSLSGMFISILLQVIMRYIFEKPLLWSEEVARYLFVYFSLIGISYAVRENSHIKMVAVTKQFSIKVQKIIETILNLLFASLFFYLAPQSISFLKPQMTIYATATKLPMFFVYVVLPIGFILTAIRLILNSINDINTLKQGEC
jgi:TRAP-type C4-dicarboxylate transport system permease small subunit